MFAFSSCTPQMAREEVPPEPFFAAPEMEEERIVRMATATQVLDQVSVDITATPSPAVPPASPNPAAPHFDTLAELGIPSAAYQDDLVGFAFDYPADWQVTALSPEIMAESTGYTATFLSHLVDRGPKQQEGLAPGQAKIDVSVFRDSANTLEEAIEEMNRMVANDGSNTELISEAIWVLPDGLQVNRRQYDKDFGQVNQMLTSIRGSMVLFTGLGDPSLFNTIAASLRVIEQ
jgi:hypothetical protein